MAISSQHDLAFWAIAIVAVFKIASLVVGLGFGYMGYRLFMAGIQRPAGELKVASGSRTLRLSRTAPGTFFALFGAVVIGATIFKGFDVELPGATRAFLSSLPEDPPMMNSDGEQ